MCKVIKDILSNVLNPCGRKKRHITISTPPFLLNIVWSGQALNVCYTQWVINSRGGMWIEPYQQKQFNYANGNNSVETIDIPNGKIGNHKYNVKDNKVFFNCTNVTSLIVNGETLI